MYRPINEKKKKKKKKQTKYYWTAVLVLTSMNSEKSGSFEDSKHIVEITHRQASLTMKNKPKGRDSRIHPKYLDTSTPYHSVKVYQVHYNYLLKCLKLMPEWQTV